MPDAVIFAKRIDMAPDGMPTMEAPIEQLPSTEPGVYRFKTNLSMAGGWQLLAWRKGPGRNRHGRKQTGSQGDAMSRARVLLLILAAITAAGIGGYWMGRHGPVIQPELAVGRRTGPAAPERSGHLLPGPGRQAVLFRRAETNRGRPPPTARCLPART